MDLQRGESKRFEAYVKSLWIQNKALSRTLCLCLLPALLGSACGGRYNPPNSQKKAIIVLSHRSVLCSYRLLWTPCVLLPSERLAQICLRG
ncbi:hypothetical protein CgunFtcFv8_015771 [Champsocephalus gunnari]|uniref:Uncharacterized protein n=1 Tax=Champsocephalus gunnari TaxID=52237 RepID=A0AAN8C7G7_CHAGU|nr:hypothetical protein CgunFtcFv8_015771 [Champsocephalus gunnari]